MQLAGLSILLIGASHLASPTYLVGPLHDELVGQGARVHSIGICGTTPSEWTQVTVGTCGGVERVDRSPPKVLISRAAKTTPLRDLVKADKPDMVIVVMGDTLANYANKGSFDKSWVNKEVWSITHELAQMNVTCVWVGPAWGTDGFPAGKTNARAKEVSDFLSTRVKPCAYFDSQQMSKPGQWKTSDGQHFYQDGYKAWSDAIVKSIKALP